MTRSKQLRADIAHTIEAVKSGSIGPAIGATIARLADVEVQTVTAEISYRKYKNVTGEIDFFEEATPAPAPARPPATRR